MSSTYFELTLGTGICNLPRSVLEKPRGKTSGGLDVFNPATSMTCVPFINQLSEVSYKALLYDIIIPANGYRESLEMHKTIFKFFPRNPRLMELV